MAIHFARYPPGLMGPTAWLTWSGTQRFPCCWWRWRSLPTSTYHFLRLPPTTGLMTLTLLSSLGLGGLGRLGVPMVLQVVEVVPGADFYTVLMQYMLSFPLFTGAMQLDMSSLGRQRVPVVMLATLGTLILTVTVACP